MAHQYPMLLIDRVREYAAGGHICAEKNITASDVCFSRTDHGLPDDQQAYAYPNSLMLESFFQAACLLGCLTNQHLATGEYVPLLGSIHDCKVHRAAFPGDRLEHRVRMLKNLEETFVFSGEILIDDEPVASIGMVLITYRKEGTR
jgi:3-hydroxyacyl-[acyl-carrier-protein] dehydratase